MLEIVTLVADTGSRQRKHDGTAYSQGGEGFHSDFLGSESLALAIGLFCFRTNPELRR